MPDSGPTKPFFLIIADLGTGLFCVEGPMTDDQPWQRAAQHAKQKQSRHIRCGPAGPDRDTLAREFQRTHKFGSVPPGSIVRPRHE